MNIQRILRGIAVFGMAGVLAFTGCDKDKNKDGQQGKGGDGGGGGTPAKPRQVHKAPAGAQLKLAFVTNNPSEFWKIAAAGIKKYEQEANVKVDVKMPPNGQAEEQMQILENLVSQGYHGIAVSVIAPKDEVSAINKAAKQTNVITHDSDAAGSNRLVYIGTNNIEAGRALGSEIKKLLPNGGKIAVFVGTLGADNARQRLDGIKQAIAGANITIVAEKEDQTDRAKARANVESVINAFPDVNVMVGLWSYNGPAIASAIEAANKKGTIKAAVFDEEDGTLNGIDSGTIQVSVVQKPFQFGYQSAKLLHQLATQGEAALPKDDAIDTGVQVISKDNVKQFRQELTDMKK